MGNTEIQMVKECYEQLVIWEKNLNNLEEIDEILRITKHSKTESQINKKYE